MVTMRRAQLATAGLTFGLALAGAAPAVAAPNNTINASAFGASVTLGGEEVIAPVPTASVGPDGGNSDPESESLVAVPGAPVATANVLNASASGDPATGTSSATGSAADVQIVPDEGLVSAQAVSATCEATAEDEAKGVQGTETGSATIAGGSIAGTPILDATPGANTVIQVPGVARVALNEQIENEDGSLTVNALRVQFIDGDAADIIIGSATCGPNTIAPPINAIPAAGLPIAGGLVALFVVGGAVWLRRRPTTA